VARKSSQPYGQDLAADRKAVDERKLLPDQTARVMIGSSTGAPPVEVFRTDEMIPTAGGPDRRLTDESRPFDGCEYTPDGEWIYCNTEVFSDIPGHAQIARLRPDGTDLHQLTFDERVNWFPHISPNAQQVLFLSFPPGTTGHPPNLPIELKLVRQDDWHSPETLVQTLGGQGTCNVNSWAPDSTRFAYVSYPINPA
jgi:TolB protein